MTDPLVIVENLNQNPTNFNGVSMILPQAIKPVVTHLSHQLGLGKGFEHRRIHLGGMYRPSPKPKY